jgi:hypothetical protein
LIKIMNIYKRGVILRSLVVITVLIRKFTFTRLHTRSHRHEISIKISSKGTS